MSESTLASPTAAFDDDYEEVAADATALDADLERRLLAQLDEVAEGRPIANESRWLAPGPVAVGDIVPTAALTEARDAVLRSLSQGATLQSLTGESGSGKTLLARELVQSTEPFAFVWLPTRPGGTRRGLLAAILRTLRPGIAIESAEADLRLALLDAAEVRIDAGTPVVLLVDEAERYTVRLIDELRGLTNYLSQTTGEPLFRVVLMGARSFESDLHRPEYEPIADRLMGETVLRGLTRDEVADYLAVQIARGGAGSLFEEHAVETLAAASPLSPGLIDRAARLALMAADADERSHVTSDDVRGVWATLDRRDRLVDPTCPQTQPETAPLSASTEAAADEWPTVKSPAAAEPIDDETLETVSTASVEFAPLDGAVVEVGAVTEPVSDNPVSDKPVTDAPGTEATERLDPTTAIDELVLLIDDELQHDPDAPEPPVAAAALLPAAIGDFATADINEVRTPLASMTGPVETVGSMQEAAVVDPHVGQFRPTPADTLELIDRTIAVASTGEGLDELERLLAERDGGVLPEPFDRDEPEDRSGEDDATPMVGDVTNVVTAATMRSVDPNFDCDAIRPADSFRQPEAATAVAVAEPTVTVEPAVTVAAPLPAAPSRERQQAAIERGFGNLFSRLRRR